MPRVPVWFRTDTPVQRPETPLDRCVHTLCQAIVADAQDSQQSCNAHSSHPPQGQAMGEGCV
ncbi:hypothetical protein GCM10010341_67490 [Streptomyces noursei]|nr:hypothetical protein GCM10010341_67490 [Streptomyces noursei]